VPKVTKVTKLTKVMDNKEFAKKLENRTQEFAVSIIRLSGTLPKTKSGTSIGANYREANRARSKADFRNKIKICESESSETQYWLGVIVKLKWLSWSKIKWEYEECGELLGIFTSAGNK
jgi:four helix bundle protein